MSEQNREPRFVQCPMCSQPTAILDPTGSIINQPKYSQIICTHEQPQRCEKCGAYIQAVIKKVALGWDYIKVDPPEEASMIMKAPAGLKI